MIVGVSCGGLATLCFHLIVREDSSEVRVSEEKSGEEGSKNPGVVSWLLNPNLYPTCFDDTCAAAALRAAAPAKEARHSAGGAVAVVFLAVGAAVAAGLVRRKRAVAADDAAPMV